MDRITDKELRMLDECQSEKDWGKACNIIKTARGNEYPDDWWDTVKQSGMMDRILSRWGASSKLSVVPFKNRNDMINHYLQGREPDHDTKEN